MRHTVKTKSRAPYLIYLGALLWGGFLATPNALAIQISPTVEHLQRSLESSLQEKLNHITGEGPKFLISIAFEEGAVSRHDIPSITDNPFTRRPSTSPMPPSR